jgi:opacity protein-like surface antigen
MRNLLLLILFTVCAAPVALAQTTDDEYHKAEFFAGFSHNRVDTGLADEDFDDDPGFDDDDFDDFFDQRTGFNGFNISATGNFHPFLGAKFDFSGHYRNSDFVLDTTQADVRSSLYNVLGGVQVKDNRIDSGSRLKPFAHALVGVGIARTEFNGSDDLGVIDDDISETGFAGAFGGGLDIRLSEKVDLRAVQLDYNPTRFFDSTQHNFRIGVGFVFH